MIDLVVLEEKLVLEVIDFELFGTIYLLESLFSIHQLLSKNQQLHLNCLFGCLGALFVLLLQLLQSHFGFIQLIR